MADRAAMVGHLPLAAPLRGVGLDTAVVDRIPGAHRIVRQAARAVPRSWVHTTVAIELVRP